MVPCNKITYQSLDIIDAIAWNEELQGIHGISLTKFQNISRTFQGQNHKILGQPQKFTEYNKKNN